MLASPATSIRSASIRCSKIFYTFGCMLLAASSSYAQLTQSDFDGDSQSDFTVVKIEGNKSLSWRARSSQNGEINDLNTIGESGDHVIMSHWLGSGRPEIGVVSYDKKAKAIAWKIKDSNGQVHTRYFGKKKDLVVSGGDFNGNGISDAAIARIRKGKVKWEISFDTFTSTDPNNIRRLNFGQEGSRAFFASPDGGPDWIGTLARNKKGKSVLKLKNLVSGRTVTSARFPSFTTKGSRPRPFPVMQADGTDILGFARTIGKKTQLDFRSIRGAKLSSFRLNGTGDVVVGDFASDAGEEVALKSGSTMQIVNPFTARQESIEIGSGIAVDQININSFDFSNSGGSGGSSSTPSGGSPSGKCNSISSWPGSHIYKTIGSEHFTDVRRNTIGLIIKPGTRGPFPSCLSVLDSKGNEIARLGLYATGGDWAARYYAGIGCGASTPLNGSAIGTRARANTGSNNIYINSGNSCIGPIDATRCIGSKQC